MSVTVRFAPSPTGYLHLGNARTALYNWLFAQRHFGVFILRFDDTDRERSRESYAAAIEEDLHWLGIRPDRTARQSERLDRYHEAAGELRRAGRLYACYETPEELDRMRSRQRARGLPPVYDRRALRLSDEERKELESEGRRPHWRFLLPNSDGGESRTVTTPRSWDDLFRGAETVDLGSLSDPVLIREDGTYLYTLPSVVDDTDFGVTHVIRGADHVTNTGVQFALFEALGATPPVFGHHNLLEDIEGEGLSKRSGALSLRRLREEGYEAKAVAAVAVLVGTSDAPRPIAGLAELIDGFDPKRVSRGPARFNLGELDSLNARQLHQTDYPMVSDRLAALGIEGGEAFWSAVRGNLGRCQDALDWWRIVHEPLEASACDAADVEFLRTARRLLPDEPWDEKTWSAWTKAVSEATGRRGRDLFMPLRRALTGRPAGPELALLLPLIGRPNTLARLPAPDGHGSS